MLGGRFDLYLDRGGLVVPGSGTGFVLAARGGLVDEITDECGAGDRCLGDGVMAAPATLLYLVRRYCIIPTRAVNSRVHCFSACWTVTGLNAV